MDVDLTLKSVLASGTGATIWALQKPEDAGLPVIVYKRISDKILDSSGEGAGHLHKTRFQLTHVASSYANLRTLVDLTRTTLEGNKTDFQAALATDIHIENKEADGIYSAVKDYFIQWKDV